MLFVYVRDLGFTPTCRLPEVIVFCDNRGALEWITRHSHLPTLSGVKSRIK